LVTHESISSIGYRYDTPHVITIYVLEELPEVRDLFPRSVMITDGSQKFTFTTEIKLGPRIVPLIAPPSIKPKTTTFPLQGGDPCRAPPKKSGDRAGTSLKKINYKTKTP